MSELVYVAGFNTRYQINTIYDIYRSLILKHSYQTSQHQSARVDENIKKTYQLSQRMSRQATGFEKTNIEHSRI